MHPYVTHSIIVVFVINAFCTGISIGQTRVRQKQLNVLHQTIQKQLDDLNVNITLQLPTMKYPAEKVEAYTQNAQQLCKAIKKLTKRLIFSPAKKELINHIQSLIEDACLFLKKAQRKTRHIFQKEEIKLMLDTAQQAIDLTRQFFTDFQQILQTTSYLQELASIEWLLPENQELEELVDVATRNAYLAAYHFIAINNNLSSRKLTGMNFYVHRTTLRWLDKKATAFYKEASNATAGRTLLSEKIVATVLYTGLFAEQNHREYLALRENTSNDV